MKKILLFAIFGMFLGYSPVVANVCTAPKVCNYIHNGGSAEKTLCKDKKTGDDCTSGKTGARKAVCKEFSKGTKSCAAHECEDGYLLWTTKARKEIDVLSPEFKSKYVGSQGNCRKKSDLEAMCKQGCGCSENEECVLNEVVVKNHDKNVEAFIGEEMCMCQKNKKEDNNISCKYVFKVFCDDGRGDISDVVKQYWSSYPEEIELTEAKLRSEKYKEYNFSDNEIATCFGGKVLEQDNPIFKKLFNKDLSNLRNFLDSEPNAVKAMAEACKKDGGFNINVQTTGGSASGSGGIVFSSVEQANHSAEIAKAQQTIDAFFANAKDNRSVWKNAEGKFNTARLASDITAGVVLGTVGGVVSGIIIKKNQVKKGFEALHCAVGGQTVADWGDEFSVGLR